MVIDRSNQSTSSPLCNCLPGPCGLTRLNIPYRADYYNLSGRVIKNRFSSGAKESALPSRGRAEPDSGCAASATAWVCHSFGAVCSVQADPSQYRCSWAPWGSGYHPAGTEGGGGGGGVGAEAGTGEGLTDCVDRPESRFTAATNFRTFDSCLAAASCVTIVPSASSTTTNILDMSFFAMPPIKAPTGPRRTAPVATRVAVILDATAEPDSKLAWAPSTG